MTQSLTMGIDLGGSGVRCLLLNTDTGETHSASRPWQFPAAPDTGGLGFDLDLNTIWTLIGEASREVSTRAGVAADNIGAVAVSAMRFGNVILDAKGEAIFAVPNRDSRAAMEFFELADQHGDTLLKETGLWPLSIQLSSRLKWLQANRPEVLERADTIVSLSDWVNYQLCGAIATDYSQAGCTGLFGLASQQWSDALIDTLGFRRDWFPAVKAAGTALGTLSSEAAKHLGLSQQVVVGLGGGDTQCSLLAAGAIKAGDRVLVAGTTAPVVEVLDKPLFDERTWAGQHLLPELRILESSGGPMGETLTFMALLLFPEAPEPELRLLAEAAQSDYGARGMLSSLGAEILDAKAPALPAGMIALSHLSCADDPNPRRHLCRALVEGYACAVRANLERLSEITGSETKAIHLTDGFSRSAVFARILADISGAEVVPARQARSAAHGAALCAGVAAGRFTDLVAAARAVSNTAKVAPANVAAGTQVYRQWRAVRDVSEEAATPKIRDHALGYLFGDEQSAVEARPEIAPELSALITAAFDDPSLERLRGRMEVKYASFRDAGRLLTGSDLVKALDGKQIFVTEIDIVDAKAVQQLPELKVVATCRGNAVNVDIEACTAFGIPVISAPGRNAVAVADLTVAFILAQARKLTDAAAFLKDESVTTGNIAKMGQAFTQLQGNELWRKTIGLVGLGAVGKMVAARLQGFGARIIAADPFGTPEAAALAGCELVSLDTLLRESDFVSLHAAVTPETTGMIGAAEFAKMKSNAFFVNTARAALVQEQALIDAVCNEQIAGAALDTFDEEPPGFDHPLVQHPKVLSTPHVAGNTVEVAAHQGESVSTALLQLVEGETPEGCLNPEVLADFSFTAPRKTLSDAEVVALMDKPAPAVTDLDKKKKEKEKATPQPGEVTAPREIVERMSALMENFCARMSSDERVAEFAADKDVCLAFNIPDIGLDFYFELRGNSDAAVGVNEAADVQLTMRAEILDGMFSGTLDTMKAAMNGDIAFIGDAGKAMAIQQLARNMKRLYTAAKEELGEPGDLASIPRPGKGGAPAVVEQVGDRDIRHELVETVRELYEFHIITATGGNVSVRNPDNPEECWITPSQMFKGDLRPEHMVRISLEGKPLDPGSRSPSSEWGFHTRTLKKKPAANAVIHAHAPNATIMANTGIPFLPISSDAAFFGDLQRIPFVMPGSDELAEKVSEAMKEEWAVLMVNHGIVVAGRSLRRASDMAQIIERTAEVILGCYQATGGKPPSVLPEEAVKLFRSLGDVIA